MFGASLARFGMERRSANSARISRSWFERHIRVCLATSAGLAKAEALTSRSAAMRADFIFRRDMLPHVPYSMRIFHWPRTRHKKFGTCGSTSLRDFAREERLV